MKTILNTLFTLGATMLITVTAYCQTTGNTDPFLVTSQKQIETLRADLDKRVPIGTDQTVGWWESNYGYSGLYMVDKTNYMATYDKKGNYVETFKKVDWNDPIVSATVKSSLIASPYKDQEVISYWESSNTNRKGYYLEVKGKDGKTSRIWADDKGKFYDRPYEYKVKTPNGEE